LWRLLPKFRRFARGFYGVPGAAMPGVMTLAGEPLVAWPQYSLSPTMSAWLANLFYLHWRHTFDRRFLRERAYPFSREVGLCLRALLQPDSDGVLKLPLSSSPEIFENSREAFLRPNSNFDVAVLKMLFVSLSEMATALGRRDAARQWSMTARRLGDLHTKSDGTLLIDESTPLPGSHRHLSHLIALHPFNLVTVDGSDRDRQIIRSSINEWDSSGTSLWCGYTFAWTACLHARAGDGDNALRYLQTYVKAFILRNGFHANGDQTRSGISNFTYRPFTIEGNFLAMEAVHEMLLQSWSSTPGVPQPGVVRIFAAMPEGWRSAAFENLRAEGGYKVSASRENGETTWFRIEAGRSGLLRIRDNFGGRRPHWSRTSVRESGRDFEVWLGRGEIIEATFARQPASF
jgi:alpha-L-fucosidase 2